MNAKERNDLRKWVQSGHSPYDNGWHIATEAGEPMDFINALRLVESEASYRVAYDAETDNLMFMVDADASERFTTEELPFKKRFPETTIDLRESYIKFLFISLVYLTRGGSKWGGYFSVCGRYFP